MSMTSYYSFGGEILGEETSGARRDYLTDALGSVTATVTGAGVVENTYRYKPYGEQLAKTGVGSDPNLRWNGKWGYRYIQGLSHVYVRLRNMSYTLGQWTSKDIFYLSSIPHAMYKYSSNSPASRIDPIGLKDEKNNGLVSCSISRLALVSGFLWWRSNMIGPGVWRDLMDDWFFEQKEKNRFFSGRLDARIIDIRRNIGFRKLLDCWTVIWGTGCAAQRQVGGGSRIDEKGFLWHYAYPKWLNGHIDSDAPGGIEAYTDATHFLGSYYANINFSGRSTGNPCKRIVRITVQNTSGWESATRIPKYNWHFPNVERNTFPCGPFVGIEPIGGNMYQTYTWEEEIDICNTTCDLKGSIIRDKKSK